MRNYYTIKEIILGLRDYSINFNNELVNLGRFVNISKKEEPYFYMSFSIDEYNSKYSLNYITKSKSKIKNLAISQQFINKIRKVDTGYTIISSNSDISIPSKMEKNIVDKDKFCDKVYEIVNDEFVSNTAIISNKFKNIEDDLPFPAKNKYVDEVIIEPSKISLFSHTLNKSLEYNFRTDKLTYKGPNYALSSEEIDAFLNVQVPKKYLNNFILNMIEINLIEGADIVVEKFSTSYDGDPYKQTTRRLDMDVALNNKVLYLSRM